MRIPAIAAFASLAACGSSMESSRPAPPAGKPALIVEVTQKVALPLAGSVFWDGTNKPASISYRGKSDSRPTLTLRQESPSGFSLVADYGKASSSLPATLPENCDDGYGGLKEGCYGQLGLVDFRKDGNPDVIVAFGDGRMSFHVNVIRYHAPASASDTRSENWELIGSFEGQSQVRIDNTKLELPIGSNGAGNEFVYVRDRFLDYQAAIDPLKPTPEKKVANAPADNRRTLAAGAPICDSFKGALTAMSVMRSNNPIAIDAVLTRQGCEKNPKRIFLELGSSIEDLGNGVVVVRTPSGATGYTFGSAISPAR